MRLAGGASASSESPSPRCSSSSISRTAWTRSGSRRAAMPFSPSSTMRACSASLATGLGSSLAHLRRFCRSPSRDGGRGHSPHVEDFVAVEALVHHRLLGELGAELGLVSHKSDAPAVQNPDCAALTSGLKGGWRKRRLRRSISPHSWKWRSMTSSESLVSFIRPM